MALSNKGVRQHGLSSAGREVLAIIEGAGNPLSPSVIARRMIVSTATLTSVLDTLERRGLVTRSPDPVDRRRLLIDITVEGRAFVDDFLPEIVALQTAALRSLGEADRGRLLGLLAVIADELAGLDVDEVVSGAPARQRRDRG